MRAEWPIVLHIGRHKSGTTALQQHLHRHRVALRAQGFLYPAAGQGRRIAHHDLAEAFMQAQGADTPALAETIQRFEQALAAETEGWHGTLVISSEAFQNVAPAHVARLFPPAQTRVVVYLREQGEYLVSAYQQHIQASTDHGTLAQYHQAVGTLSYERFLQKWAGVYGEDRLQVARYERQRLLGGDIVQDFCQRTGLPLLAPPEGEDQNPSIGGALLEVKRLSNALAPDITTLHRTYDLYRRVALSDPRWQQKPVLPADTLAQLREAARAGNAAVSARYFGGEPLFNPRPAAHAHAPTLPASELGQALAALLRARPAYAGELLRRLVAPYVPEPGELPSVCERLTRALLNGRTPLPPRLIRALRTGRHTQTGRPWLWNSAIDWQS